MPAIVKLLGMLSIMTKAGCWKWTSPTRIKKPPYGRLAIEILRENEILKDSERLNGNETVNNEIPNDSERSQSILNSHTTKKLELYPLGRSKPMRVLPVSQSYQR